MTSLGAERSVQLFPPADWLHYDWAAGADAPYPGLRPTGSWLLTPDRQVHGLDAVESGWQNRTTGESVETADRIWVLAYGSNADPLKLLEKDGFLGGDSVIALRAAIIGWAAAWCDARRDEGSVVATLVPAPGRVEVHPILGLTEHQLAVMDDWERHPNTYCRTRHNDPVLLESGQPAEHVQVYLGTQQRRPALLHDGRHLLCADVPYEQADALVAR
ncbi:gamma-glutamylcyclotransferase [Mycobacterium sp. M1]|uniref:Gamma-glutamylcyclotransferase n=1 Tax=Mycolicibacter acidiphilus TaxID=2835306 RepID=A0ABS5RCS2_9MYCO|nr:gamma-glutamylcyclotransferase family protein [Mycolicibacter acidiphilus]MBS9532083.1 gamma-glutamylcyclotransferase [Mycolicibacter acidiphilus]